MTWLEAARTGRPLLDTMVLGIAASIVLVRQKPETCPPGKQCENPTISAVLLSG